MAPRNSGQPGAGVHRVPGDSPRSAGVGWRCPGYGIAGPAGNVDSSATGAIARSYDIAARGVNWLDVAASLQGAIFLVQPRGRTTHAPDRSVWQWSAEECDFRPYWFFTSALGPQRCCLGRPQCRSAKVPTGI